MSIAEWVAAIQTNGIDSQRRDPAAAGYFVIALVAVALGMVVLILIRSSARRSTKRQR